MRSAYTRLLADGLAREAAASALDLGQLICRAWDLPPARYWRQAIAVVKRCLECRADLAVEHREGLGRDPARARKLPRVRLPPDGGAPPRGAGAGARCDGGAAVRRRCTYVSEHRRDSGGGGFSAVRRKEIRSPCLSRPSDRLVPLHDPEPLRRH